MSSPHVTLSRLESVYQLHRQRSPSPRLCELTLQRFRLPCGAIRRVSSQGIHMTCLLREKNRNGLRVRGRDKSVKPTSVALSRSPQCEGHVVLEIGRDFWRRGP